MQNPFWHPKSTLNCKGRLIQLEPAAVMGILNVTPDSFYADSRLTSVQQVIDRAGVMIDEGADILDIGGYSSRPGAEEISVHEELDRVLHMVSSLHQSFPEIPISVDTFRSQVAMEAIQQGASMVNDISGGQLDPGMWQVVSSLQVPYVLMHMRGTPRTMQSMTDYQDVAVEILDWLIDKVGQLRQTGIHDILVDPGFGFGKTAQQNFQLLHQLHTLSILGLPVMVGISRKSMIWKTLGTDPTDALQGTTALHLIALQQGAKILRVHDVKPARQTIQLWDAYQKSNP
ncbi:MAG: dihydropteroate synthase [Saprospiraceae bacterium]|nr:dihydropteroate synthase [Saprospiraceae bacterium]